MDEKESIFQHYFQGISTEEEHKIILDWLNESAENKKNFFAEKDIWEKLGYQANVKHYFPDQELQKLKQNTIAAKRVRSVKIPDLLKYAAILVLAIGLGWFGHSFFNSKTKTTPELSWQDVVAPKGQINQVFLADGTRVWVNSDTKLTIPSVFSADERLVKLDGEAFFEVAKEKNRPFRIAVNGQQIEVLGTSFNVRAYANSNLVETTLETGSVKLITGKQTNLLHPGEQALFNLSDRSLSIIKVNPTTISSWKDGRYAFNNESLVEVFKVVERWYDVDIDVDQKYLEGVRFTGVIKRNKDVKHFLDLLAMTVPIKYQIEKDKVWIKKK